MGKGASGDMVDTDSDLGECKSRAGSYIVVFHSRPLDTSGDSNAVMILISAVNSNTPSPFGGGGQAGVYCAQVDQEFSDACYWVLAV